VTKVLLLAFHWVQAHWTWIVGVLIPILLVILNSATRRFSMYPKATSWLMFFVDLLSAARAKGTPDGAILGKAKIPLFQLSMKSDEEKAGDKKEAAVTAQTDAVTAQAEADTAQTKADTAQAKADEKAKDDTPPSRPPTPPSGFATVAVLTIIACALGLALLLSGCANTTLGKLGQLQASVKGLRESGTVVLDNRCADLVPKCPDGGLAKCDSYQKCAAARRIIYGTASGLQVSIDAAASLASLGKDAQAKELLPAITDGLNKLIQQLTYYDVLGAAKTVLAAPAAPPPPVVPGGGGPKPVPAAPASAPAKAVTP